jgi:hypothetical protein
MGLAHGGDQFFLAYALLLGPDHYRRAVRVVRADIYATMTAELLKTDPNVGLQVLYQMPDVDMAVGIRQCAGNQDFSHIKFISAGKAAADERKQKQRNSSIAVIIVVIVMIIKTFHCNRHSELRRGRLEKLLSN